MRLLREHGHRLVELNRPDSAARHRQGETGRSTPRPPLALWAGTAVAQPKAGKGVVEMIRSLEVVRRSAQKARSPVANQLRAWL